jgi:hypothetical protein
LKGTNPLLAKRLEKELLKSDDDATFNGDIDSIVKYYPGSAKGPNPADDPAHYSEWFMRNQPIEEIYGKDAKPDFKDIGVRHKYVYNKATQDEDAMKTEQHDEIMHHISRDEAYNMQGYDGIAEFDIADRNKYDLTQGGKLPFMRFHSHMKEDELLPLPDNHTLDYTKVHYELERWTLFMSLP